MILLAHVVPSSSGPQLSDQGIPFLLVERARAQALCEGSEWRLATPQEQVEYREVQEQQSRLLERIGDR